MEETLTSTQRIEWIDALKFIGIFAIAWGHTMSAESYAKTLLYAFHVPLFFFLPGLYLSSKKKLDLSKYAKRLLIPYFLIAMLSLAILMVLGRIATDALAVGGVNGDRMKFLPNFLKILCGFCRANRPLWFLPSLFVFYAILYPLLKIIEMLPKGKWLCAVLFMVLSVTLCRVLTDYLQVKKLPWSTDIALFMVAFFFAAYLSRPVLLHDEMPHVLGILLGVALLIFGGALSIWNYKLGGRVNYLDSYFSNVYLFYLSALLTILGLCFVARIYAPRFMKVIGQKTLPILLLHKFPILFFQTIIPWTKQPLRDGNLVVALLVAVMSVLLCLIADFIFSQLMRMILKHIRTKRFPATHE